MPFLASFFGSFYSQALYRRLRLQETGFGVHYSLLLLGFIAVISISVVMVRLPGEMRAMLPQLQAASPAAWLVVAAGAILMRGLMLLALAVAARLAAMRLRMPMDYATAFRLAGVAYTPVAVLDAVAFCLRGEMLQSWLLFPCGVLMLLAALYSTR